MFPALDQRDTVVLPRNLHLLNASALGETATKERGEKKLVVISFYVATNFTKL